MLSVERVSKSYATDRQSVKAVDSVSVSVPRGSFLTLLGPSGCGKTTLLRCLAGLENPSAGEIRIDDRVVFSHAAKITVPVNKRDIGMVFQSYAIWPHMTVFQNVAFPLVCKRASDIRGQAMAAIAMVGLDGLHDRNASRLSGGQQQRVALARAIVGNPAILLLDEPLSNLDAGLRDQMRGELRSLQKRVGITTVCVTHDQNEALSMSDQIALMANGRIVETASPEDLYESPRTVFAAKFIGGANILEGKAFGLGPNGVNEVHTALGVLKSSGAGTGDVSLFIRPERAAPVLPSASIVEGANLLTCTIVGRRFVGGDLELDLLVDGASGGVQLRSKCSSAYQCREGDRARIMIRAEDVRILQNEGLDRQ